MAEIIVDLPIPESLVLNAVRIDKVTVSSNSASINYFIGHKDNDGNFQQIRTGYMEITGEQFADFVSVIDYTQVASKLSALLTLQQ